MDKDSQGRKIRPDYNFFEWGMLINDQDGYPVIRLPDSINESDRDQRDNETVQTVDYDLNTAASKPSTRTREKSASWDNYS
jgi:hypothetical protein